LCPNGQNERKISLIYHSPGNTLPCEVRYTKNGAAEVLWNAKKIRDYCEEEFAEKLEDSFWICNRTSADRGAVSTQAKEGNTEADAE